MARELNNKSAIIYFVKNIETHFSYLECISFQFNCHLNFMVQKKIKLNCTEILLVAF